MIGDGQVSQGSMVVKPNATKVRKLGSGQVLAGFAGSTADALTLVERLESKLEEHDGQSITRPPTSGYIKWLVVSGWSVGKSVEVG